MDREILRLTQEDEVIRWGGNEPANIPEHDEIVPAGTIVDDSGSPIEATFMVPEDDLDKK